MANKRLQQRKMDKAAHQQANHRIWWMVGGILIIAGVVVALLTQSQPRGGAPLFSSRTVTGDKVSLSDFRGQVVMLNFWATWCPPCRAEMPVIESAYQKYRDQGFTVLAVNNAESNDAVKTFATQFRLSFPVVLDEAAQVQHQFGITGYPTSIFLDANGDIYATHSGGLTATLLTNYIETGLKRTIE